MADSNLRRQNVSKASLRQECLRTISIILIAPAITLVGYFINNTIHERALEKEYLELAISVLREPEPGANADEANGLRTWACDLFKLNSPIPVPDELSGSLCSGDVVFPNPPPPAPAISAYRDTESDAHCDSHLRYGHPSDDQTLCRLGFALSYDQRMNLPSWVGYRLLADRQRVVDQRFPILPDPALPDGRTVIEAFRGSSFDRGHLVPSFEMAWSYMTAREVQFHSNLSPQDPALNRGGWAALDRAIHEWVEERDVLYVVAGPVFASSNARTLNDVISVPESYFKVVYDPAEQAVLAFLLPNNENAASYESLSEFLVTVDKVEEVTSLDLLSELTEPLQENLEKELGRIWELRP